MAGLNAKERVEQELEELNEKIVKLSGFLFGSKLITANLSAQMVCEMRDQLRAMEDYAFRLQRRLLIWDKTDKQLNEERDCCRIGY